MPRSNTTFDLGATPQQIIVDINGVKTPFSKSEFDQRMGIHRGNQFHYQESLILPLKPEFAVVRKKYKQIEKAIIDFTNKIDFSAFEIFYINEKCGYGLRTTKAFKKGALLLPYSGEIYCENERTKEENLQDIYSYKPKKGGKYSITAQIFGGLSSLMNWMPDAKNVPGLEKEIQTANIVIAGLNLTRDKMIVLPFFYAKEDIPEKTQLGWDWGTDFFTARAIMPKVFSRDSKGCKVAPASTHLKFYPQYYERATGKIPTPVPVSISKVADPIVTVAGLFSKKSAFQKNIALKPIFLPEENFVYDIESAAIIEKPNFTS